jgi:hypothetical protein
VRAAICKQNAGRNAVSGLKTYSITGVTLPRTEHHYHRGGAADAKAKAALHLETSFRRNDIDMLFVM